MGKLLGAMRKAGWNLGDQILSAASNVLLSIVVARSVDASTFGAFAIAFVLYGIGVAFTRSAVGQPLQIRYASATPDAQRDAMRRGHGAAFVIGLIGALAAAGGSRLFDGSLSTTLLALSICLPGLLVQDSQRLTFFAIGRAWGALVIDAWWTVFQFGALAVLISTGHTAVAELVLAWGVSATSAALLGALLLRAWPRPLAAFAWIKEVRDLIRYLLAEYFLGLGASQISILLVGGIATQQAVGSIRAGQTLLGPLNILAGACFNFTVPEIARRTHLQPKQRLLAGHMVSGLMGSSTIVYVILLLVMPDWMGAQLFKDSWAGAAGVLLPLGVSALFSSLANGLAGVLYGLGRADQTFRINLAKAPVIPLAVLGGTWLGGAVGAAWGIAVAEAFVLPLWYRAFRRAALAEGTSHTEESTDVAGQDAPAGQDGAEASTVAEGEVAPVVRAAAEGPAAPAAADNPASDAAGGPRH